MNDDTRTHIIYYLNMAKQAAMVDGCDKVAEALRQIEQLTYTKGILQIENDEAGEE